MATEKRLIDVDEFRNEMYEYVLPYTTGNLMGAADAYYRTIHLLDDAPTVDAVEVVRCKDCKDRVFDNASGETWCNNPRGLSSMITDNYFCPFGERSHNED